MFFGRLNSHDDCEVLLRGGSTVDREDMDKFDVTVTLDNLSAYVNPRRKQAKVIYRTAKNEWLLVKEERELCVVS